MNYNIALPYFESAQKYPEKLALYADGENYSYRELLDRVLRVADWLARGDEGSPKRVGILGSRSAEACIGILAAAWVGAAYVPISLKQPELAMAGLLKRSGLGALIADRTGSQMLSRSLLQHAPAKTLVIERDPRSSIRRQIAYFEELPSGRNVPEPAVIDADDVAYILYTSGSTGTPKGVMLPAKGIHHLLNVMQTNYPLSPEDRMAETTETSFDLTVYNMFATWHVGASLHVIPLAQAAAPAKYIQEHQITSWLSVPSIAVFMNRMGLLKPGAFPSLRYTFFAGEPLLTSLAEAWQVAAPNSVVANMYGPTEATVICIGQEYGPGSVATRDSVAIGRPFRGMQAAIAAGEKEFAAPGTQGELLLGGPQLALGYLDDPQKTADRFVTIGEKRWYRTGDLSYCDTLGIFHYLGRVDNQVKILGYRVELEEIECHLRDASGCADVAAVAWPIQSGIASGVVGFLVNFDGSIEEVKAALALRVPTYMVPTRVHVLSKLPLNNNGKVDRHALQKMLEREPVV
jgi:D-alanine--poly(phosphoribitol) ligase subunit 1